MLFTSSGTFYSKVQFKTEEEVVKVVAHNFKLLFGDYSILLPKSLIRTSGGKGTIPDGIIIDFKGKILEKDPIVSLPMDYSPSDLEEWASMQKVDVQIQHIEKYMNAKGEVLYNFPDLELTQEKESLKTTSKSNALYEIVKAGLLNVGDIVHFEYGPKGKPKTYFEGKVCSDGIEVDGIVSSASVSALRCIQQISPLRTTTNGGNDILYHFAKGGAIVAKVRRVGSRFILLAGSKLSLKYEFRSPGWTNVRENASVSPNGILRSDVECESSSMAAYLVAGGPRNGLSFWKNKDRKELKTLEK